MAPISLGFWRSPRLQEFFHATALSRVAFLLQFPAEPTCVVAPFCPPLLQVLPIRFQTSAVTPWPLLGKFCGLQKAPYSLSRQAELVRDGALSQTALVCGSHGLPSRLPSFPSMLALLLVPSQLDGR